MNFPFTEVDFAGEDPSAPIIPSVNGANVNRSTSKIKKVGLDTSQVTNSKVGVKIDDLVSNFVLYDQGFER